MNIKRKRIYIVVLIVLAIVTMFIQSFRVIKMNNQMGKYESISDSVQMKKGKFLNVEPTKTMLKMSGSTLKAFFKKGEKVPPKALPIIPFNAHKYLSKDANLLSVTWFGHSAALLEIDGKLILTDPALSERAGPTTWTGTKRFHNMVPVTVTELPQLDVVLISHDHFDHLDKKTIIALNEKTNRFIVPLGITAYLTKWGINPEKIQELAWWDSITISGTNFISTPARHFSGRGLFDRNTTLWCSWVIQGANHSVYFSGDSGYQKEFKTIGKKYGPFDLSLLECGQYNDDWGLIHMSPEESVQAAIDLKTKLALPIHWGAFSLSVHSWFEPVVRFSKEAADLDLKIIAPKIGQRIVINDSVSTDNWWK